MIALIGVTELLSALIIWLITDVDISSLNDEGMGRFLAIIFSQTMVLFIYIITNKKVNKKRMNLKNNSYYLMIGSILFFTVTSILIVIWMYGNIQTNNVSIKEYMVTLTMCVLMLSVISIALTNKIINDMEEKHKLDLELQHVKMERQYFSDVNSALEEIRILRHDMRGELAIIHGYNEMDQKDKIRNHIEKKLLEMDVELIPQLDKDNIITSFLNFKLKEAQIKGITVEIESNLSEENTVFIDKEDICRILNNILNNAIEANNDCDEKYIQIILKIVNDYIVIKSENPFSGNIINENGIIQTLKKDKTKHGYGLKSIKGIAEKYSGFIDIKYDSNSFKVMVQMLNKI
jgi:signal transduction histidine kinase